MGAYRAHRDADWYEARGEWVRWLIAEHARRWWAEHLLTEAWRDECSGLRVGADPARVAARLRALAGRLEAANP